MALCHQGPILDQWSPACQGAAGDQDITRTRSRWRGPDSAACVLPPREDAGYTAKSRSLGVRRWPPTVSTPSLLACLGLQASTASTSDTASGPSSCHSPQPHLCPRLTAALPASRTMGHTCPSQPLSSMRSLPCLLVFSGLCWSVLGPSMPIVPSHRSL